MKKAFRNISNGFKNFNLEELLSVDTIMRNIGYFAFLAVLVLFYIGNTHFSERTIRSIDRMKNKLREERWQYMTAKNELMFNTKQTELAERVKARGLKELKAPPKKIVIKKGEY